MDSKEVEQSNLNFIKKLKKLNCSLHIENFYSNICVEPNCEKKGLLCGECMFEFHSEHVKLCIPINYFKFCPNENEQKDLIKTYEESLINLKEKINSIINDEIEKLASMVKIKSLKDLIEFNDSEHQDNIIDIIKNITYIKNKDNYIINDEDYQKTIKGKIKNLSDNLRMKLEREFKCKLKELVEKEIYSLKDLRKSSIRSIDILEKEWSNAEKKSDFLSFIPKANFILRGYGRLKYWEQSKLSIEISIYDQHQKTFIYRENLEGNDLDKNEIITDHIFADIVNIRKGVQYTIIETNLVDNQKSYYLNSVSVSNIDFEFSNGSTPPDINSNGTCTTSGKFGYFLVSSIED